MPLDVAGNVVPATREERIGFFFPLLLLYPIFEYGRPENPMRIPMIVSFLLFLGWLCQRNKKWHPQIRYFFALLAIMSVGTLLAANTYSAFWHTYSFAVTLLCICVPFVHFVTSFLKITAFIRAFLFACVYVALYAIFHDGAGPGWQDENYVAAIMSMAFPFAYFSIFVARYTVTKIVAAIVAGLFVAAVVVSFSRGGFLGIAVVLFYCLFRSPRAWPVYAVASVLAATIALFATPEYWAEMKSIGDMREKTIEFRLDLWQIAYRMFTDSPIVGVGPGNFLWNAGDYQSAAQFARYGRSLAANAVTHSLYFELLAELGLAGLIVFGATLYRNYADLTFVAGATQEEQADVRYARYYERAITGGFVGVLVCGASVSMFYYSHFWILTAMAMALKDMTRAQIASGQRRHGSQERPAPEWRRRASRGASISSLNEGRRSRGRIHGHTQE